MSVVHRLIPFALLVLGAAPARAHEPPRGIGLLWASDAASSPSVIVANRGLVFVDDTDIGPRFSLRCCEAYGANIGDRPSVFMEPSGALTVGVYNGVLNTGDRGCTFAAGTGLPTSGETLGNLAGAVGMPGRLFVSTRTFSGYAALFQSEDYGHTWTERFKNPVDHQFDVLLVAPTAPERLYAAGRWRDLPNQKLNFVTALSQNLGANWQEQEGPLKAVAFAVHPGNADVVFAYQPIDTLETQFRLLRSADRGATFVTALEDIPKPTVIAAAAEAESLWLGVDGKGGLFHSSDAGQHFEKVFVADVQAVSCLVRRQGRLWMCANLAPNTNGVWFSDDDGYSFRRWMIFEDVLQQVACSGEEANAACARAWYDYDIELHPPGVDAGVSKPLGLNLDAGPREAGAPGQPADAGADDGSSAGEGGAALDAGVGTDAALVPLPPGGDAGASLVDAGPGFDAGGAAAAQDAAVTQDAQSASEAGWPWSPRRRRHSDGCNAGPIGSFDALGSWLLGAALVLLSRLRKERHRRARMAGLPRRRIACMLPPEPQPRSSMKPRDFIHVLENPAAPPISQRSAETEQLLTLVAKLFFADRVLDEREVKLVQRLAAGVPDVPSYMQELSARPLDLQKLAATFPDSKDRDDIVTLAEHAVWGDDEVDSREWDIVDQLVEVLGIDRP